MYRLGVLFVWLHISMCADQDCSCLIYSECIAYFYYQSSEPTIDCSRLTHFERYHRGSSLCKKPEKPYHCAWDLGNKFYGEICAKTIDIYPGFRPTRQLGLHQDHCTEQRYQPFFIESNLTYQCIYEKSACKEEGQMVYNNGSVIHDRSCFCNFEEGYAFLVQLLNKFYCIPSIDDCTCYKKSCPDGSYTLDREYNCIQNNGLQLALKDSYRTVQSFETPITVYNSVYGNTAYNKDIKTDFRKLSVYIIVGIMILSVWVSVGFFVHLLFLAPLSLTIKENVILFKEDADLTIECTVIGRSVFKDVLMYKVNTKGDSVSEKQKLIHTEYTIASDSRKVTFYFKYVQKDDEGEYQCKIQNIVGRTRKLRVTLKCIKELTVLEEWQLKDVTKIVKTELMEKVKEEVLKTSNCVIITGHSGSGKSTVMRHVALELQRKENYKIFVAFLPEEIEQHCDVTKRQVFVFDDVFGKYAINLHILEKWIFSMHKITTLLDSGNLKILTCRSNIVDKKQFKKLNWLMKTTFNIQDYTLKDDTLKEITEKYLGKGNSVILELKSITNFDLFPLLCETLVNCSK